MTLEYSHNRFIKVLALLLIVCLLVSCCLSFKADAAGAGVAAALYAVGGAAVVGSILHAMGIFHGDAHTDWDSLVTAVLGHLGSLGYVTADGKIKLSVLGAGVTMIPGAIISAVRDYLFGDNGCLSYTAAVYVPNALSDYVSSHTYSYYFYYADSTFYHLYLSDSPFILSTTEKDDGDNLLVVTLFASSASDIYRSTYDSRYSSWSSLSLDNSVAVGLGYYAGPDHSYQYRSWVSNYFTSPKGNYSISSSSVDSSSDLTVTGVPDKAADDSATPDVIYPGWATNATNVDTNIDVVADAGTGAIDGVITADKYFPIGITDLGVSIYDQTQAGAQTGTDASVIESEADAVKDSTKEDVDSFAIGPMSDYTMQLKDFFPFCIPFDIYDMLNCLSADPEAPSFDWKIPVLGQDNIIHVDLAQFNTVASILRTMELLAFCVGLAFATKHLIQGGAG